MREKKTQCVSLEMEIHTGNVESVSHSNKTDHKKKHPVKRVLLLFHFKKEHAYNQKGYA